LVLIIPIIYILSWRTCRNLRQAFQETVAWCVGYLITGGVLLLMSYGNWLDLVSGRPDQPGALIAILGGFGGMLISRTVWKRRGGHLKQSSNRWIRAFNAARSNDVSKARPRR
jgi:hypothetical protein